MTNYYYMNCVTSATYLNSLSSVDNVCQRNKGASKLDGVERWNVHLYVVSSTLQLPFLQEQL